MGMEKDKMARGQAAESRVFSVSGRVETVETNTSDSEFYNAVGNYQNSLLPLNSVRRACVRVHMCARARHSCAVTLCS